ncbi:hypothetical protein GCM10020001_086480 [Nonomuraea salmonea]
MAGAALIGFAGNEWVARYRIKVGKEIGSAALVADGLHARTDGFTSLAVLLGAGGAALGLPLADPVVGLLITVAICFVLRDAAREIYRRLMDAVDPALVDAAERILTSVNGVRRVGSVRLRWIGHALHAEVEILVPPRHVRHHRSWGRGRSRTPPHPRTPTPTGRHGPHRPRRPRRRRPPRHPHHPPPPTDPPRSVDCERYGE